MKKLAIPIILIVLLGCTHSPGAIKQVYLGYHNTLKVIQEEVVLAKIDGKIDEDVAYQLYVVIDTAVQFDNLTKRLIMSYEDGDTTAEIVSKHIQELSYIVFNLAELARSNGVPLPVGVN